MNEGGQRDAFLRALDARDLREALRLGELLAHNRVPLPSGVCADLGLPRGSTYAAAVAKIARGAVGPERPPSRTDAVADVVLAAPGALACAEGPAQA